MQVVIHAGAAFTDEGRVLNSLKKNRSKVIANGVTYFGHRRYKLAFKPALDTVDAEPVEPVPHQDLKGLLPAGKDTKRVIYSTAHFAGAPETALSNGQLYPYAGRRMAFLEQSFQDHSVELFMALRNPGSLLPKLLMLLPEEQRADALRNTDLSCLSWIGMVEDIRDLAPNVKVTLWSFEDTPFVWGDIMRAVAGLDKDTPVQDEHDLLLSLLDETGKNQIHSLTAQSNVASPAALREDLAHVFEEHALPDSIEEELDFPGWSTDIVDAFSELYDQDIERLANMSGVRVIQP